MKNYARIFVATVAAAGTLALAPVKADAAVIALNFDQIAFEGGTVTTVGGDAVGSDIIFTAITLTVDGIATSTVQCGSATSTTEAQMNQATNACLLNFDTATGAFVVTAPGGVYDAGPDLLAFTGDTGAQILAPGSVVLDGLIGDFTLLPNFFTATGLDTKHEDLLAFFGLSGLNFRFLNTEIFFGSGENNVIDADIVNTVVPEPGSLALLGFGLLAAGRAVRRRRTA